MYATLQVNFQYFNKRLLCCVNKGNIKEHTKFIYRVLFDKHDNKLQTATNFWQKQEKKLDLLEA